MGADFSAATNIVPNSSVAGFMLPQIGKGPIFDLIGRP